ncbi:hypothetical protein LCGC14_2011150, partial [marine sediment metagenome]
PEQSSVITHEKLKEQKHEEIQEEKKEESQDLENIELVDPEVNPLKEVEPSSALDIRKYLEKIGESPELEDEYLSESSPEKDYAEKLDETTSIDHNSESLDPKEKEYEDINKIILEAEKMEFLGEHVSSHEEMKLEEKMEEIISRFEEEGLKQEQGLETSNELNQENKQNQEEIEKKTEEIYSQNQEKKKTLELKGTQEQDKNEEIKEFSGTKIKEKEQEISHKIGKSNKRPQEFEEKIKQEIQQSVVQKETQKQIEIQKDQVLKKSNDFSKDRYKQETGRRSIYAGKETKGFIEWKNRLKEENRKEKEKKSLSREIKVENQEQTKEIREFKEEWAEYLEQNIKESEFSEKNEAELIEKLEGCSFRVLKSECLDLPEKIYKRHPVQLSPNQRKVYDDLVQESLAEFEGEEITADLAIVKLLRLQQVVCGWFPANKKLRPTLLPLDDVNPRIKALQTILEDVEGKVIIWCRFVADLEQIYATLRHGIKGQAILYRRVIEDVNRFQNDPEIKYFIANPAMGGLGLTLTAAETVVYYSNSFDLEHRLQSEDRSHRIGTKKNVVYVDIQAQGTVDGKIITALRNKKHVADAILQDPTTFFLGE